MHRPCRVEVVVGEDRLLPEVGEEVAVQNLTLEEAVGEGVHHQEAEEVEDRPQVVEEAGVRRSTAGRHHFAGFLSFVFCIRL